MSRYLHECWNVSIKIVAMSGISDLGWKNHLKTQLVSLNHFPWKDFVEKLGKYNTKGSNGFVTYTSVGSSCWYLKYVMH